MKRHCKMDELIGKDDVEGEKVGKKRKTSNRTAEEKKEAEVGNKRKTSNKTAEEIKEADV